MRRLGALLVAAFVALAGSAIAQTSGGKLTFAIGAEVGGFDPLTVGVYDSGARAVATLLFDTLTRLGDDGKAKPGLALSWSASPDLKDWTFKLRQGVKFHDGTSFDADAVVFNYRRNGDPDNHCRCAIYLAGIKKVEALDPQTVVFHLRVPAAKLPELIAIAGPTTVVGSPSAIKVMGAAYNRHPNGTGPFRLKSWATGDAIVLERNPDFWEEGRPYLDEITVRALPDGNSRFAALKAGDVDIIWHDLTDDVTAARKDAGLVVRQYDGSGASEIVYNMRKPPLDDLRVRQALSLAVDMQGISDNLTAGIFKPAQDPYGPGSFVKCAEPGRLPYDVARAKALLKDYGKPVTVKLMVLATPLGAGTGQLFQDFWREIGVTTQIEAVDQVTYISRMLSHDYEVGGWQIVDLADPAPQMFAGFYSKSAINLAGYANEEVDRLLIESGSIEDEAKRTDDYCRIAQILNHDVPWLWALQEVYFSIAKTGLDGLHRQFSDTIDLRDAYWAKGK